MQFFFIIYAVAPESCYSLQLKRSRLKHVSYYLFSTSKVLVNLSQGQLNLSSTQKKQDEIKIRFVYFRTIHVAASRSPEYVKTNKLWPLMRKRPFFFTIVMWNSAILIRSSYIFKSFFKYTFLDICFRLGISVHLVVSDLHHSLTSH